MRTNYPHYIYFRVGSLADSGQRCYSDSRIMLALADRQNCRRECPERSYAWDRLDIVFRDTLLNELADDLRTGRWNHDFFDQQAFVLDYSSPHIHRFRYGSDVAR